MNIDELLNYWDVLKEQLRDIQYEENMIKKHIHSIMNSNNTNRLSSQDYDCFRCTRTRSVLKKTEVPPEIWDTYANEIEYPTLTLKRKT
jgi:hypothetical protein